MAASFELAEHIVGILVDKDVDRKYLEEIHGLVEEKLKTHDSINLFCEIMPGNEVPLKFIIENLKFKFDNSEQIQKLAMVTDLSWIRGIMNVDNLFVSTKVKSFELKDRLEAINWITL
ncbi:MAG: STAS/SEC14 domain-containing protein [Gramella sp.]|nr:STAS/SEC14 domain-containing protein [Christiangramia sp.]